LKRRAFLVSVLSLALGACAGLLGIEDITNDPPDVPDSALGPDGTTPQNDSSTDSTTPSEAGFDAGDAGVDVFVPPPTSCIGLAKNCGGANNDDCCTSIAVTGGTFNRSQDASAPATVPDFRLDKYEVTVGRFRKFVAGYPANIPAASTGAHPGIANSGWQVGFTMPANAATLNAALNCNQPAGTSQPTWTDQPGMNEQKPINCLTWFEAFAFCIYDGGFLPTEAEWNYAAAAGNEQRLYPWGNAPVPSPTHAVCNDAQIANVGSKSTVGDGKLGHVDLLGNASEWNLDFFGTYTACNNCANLTGTERVRRGGDLTDTCNDVANVSNAGRRSDPPGDRRKDTGVRCARLK